MSEADRGEGRADGPLGPGWSNDPDHYRGIDWGASADRKPRPKTTRNGAIATGLTSTFAAIVTLSDGIQGEFNLGLFLVAVSQLALSVALYFEYKKLLKKEAAGEGS